MNTESNVIKYEDGWLDSWYTKIKVMNDATKLRHGRKNQDKANYVSQNCHWSWCASNTKRSNYLIGMNEMNQFSICNKWVYAK